MSHKLWTSFFDIQKKMMSKWQSGFLLAEALESRDSFPLRLSLKHPSQKEMVDHFPEVQSWIKALQDKAKYDGINIEWREINHRQLGKNHLPVAIIFSDLTKTLHWLGQLKKRDIFLKAANHVLTAFPALKSWILKKPHDLLEKADVVPELLSVIQWILKNPNPCIYLRQLSIPGINTKFIEQHKNILSQWLDLLLPEEAKRHQYSSNEFASRYGFLEKPSLIRFRVLDPSLLISGLSDLTIPVEDFSQLNLNVSLIFVTENDINALTFPNFPDSIVIFGRGYGFNFLKKIKWIQNKRIVYWGDIDTHGFAILNQFRQQFPQAESIFMDEKSLLLHKEHWTIEKKPSNALLTHLTREEESTYQALKSNLYGKNIRLEQEFILFSSLLNTLNKL